MKNNNSVEEIIPATYEDVNRVKALMDGAIATAEQSDWYVVEEPDFIKQHIEEEGYILKYMIDGEIAAFLMVRHPGEAEDNLAYDLKHLWGAEDEKACNELLFQVAHMESAVVASAYRGRGLQRKLLEYAEQIESACGTKYLLATVHPENAFSLNNLLKLGFACVLEKEKYGGLRRKILCKKILDKSRSNVL